jgi:phosphoglycolate phosphatase-like HAD superfamily hydrolase
MTAAPLDNIALFDLDGSLADYTGALVRELEALRSDEEPPVTLENIWKMEKKPYIGHRMRLIKSVPGFWLNLEPIELGMLVFDWTRRFGFTNHILTKGPKKIPLAWDEKVRWCHKHLGEDEDIHITSDKGLVYGKLLYDDYPDYMLRWLKHRPRGLGIMPTTPTNKDFSHPQVVKVSGIEDMEKVFRALRICLERKPGQDLILPV